MVRRAGYSGSGPPAIFLAKNLSTLRVIPWPWGCGSFGLITDFLLSFRNLDNTVRSGGTGVLVSEGSVQVIFCFFLGAMSGR